MYFSVQTTKRGGGVKPPEPLWTKTLFFYDLKETRTSWNIRQISRTKNLLMFSACQYRSAILVGCPDLYDSTTISLFNHIFLYNKKVDWRLDYSALVYYFAITSQIFKLKRKNLKPSAYTYEKLSVRKKKRFVFYFFLILFIKKCWFSFKSHLKQIQTLSFSYNVCLEKVLDQLFVYTTDG